VEILRRAVRPGRGNRKNKSNHEVTYSRVLSHFRSLLNGSKETLARFPPFRVPFSRPAKPPESMRSRSGARRLAGLLRRHEGLAEDELARRCLSRFNVEARAPHYSASSPVAHFNDEIEIPAGARRRAGLLRQAEAVLRRCQRPSSQPVFRPNVPAKMISTKLC